MRKSIAVIVPVIAASVLAIGCSDPITQPRDTARMGPVDTLMARSPIDTFASAQRAPIDTFARAQRAPIDTFARAQRMPVDTFASARMPIDTFARATR
ncbi:MAG TPA: hypothetical protein VF142_03810 [Longimicrobium sp.]